VTIRTNATNLSSGVTVAGNAAVTLSDATIAVNGGGADAIDAGVGGSILNLTRVSASVTTATITGEVLYLYNGTLTADQLIFRASSVSGGANGIDTYKSTVTVTNSSITAIGSPAYAISNSSGDLTIRNTTALATAASSSAYALFALPERRRTAAHAVAAELALHRNDNRQRFNVRNLWDRQWWSDHNARRWMSHQRKHEQRLQRSARVRADFHRELSTGRRAGCAVYLRLRL